MDGMKIEQLKARAYDLIVTIEQATQELNAVNRAIQEESQKDLPADKKKV